MAEPEVKPGMRADEDAFTAGDVYVGRITPDGSVILERLECGDTIGYERVCPEEIRDTVVNLSQLLSWYSRMRRRYPEAHSEDPEAARRAS